MNKDEKMQRLAELQDRLDELMVSRAELEATINKLQRQCNKLEQELLNKQADDIRNFLDDHTPVDEEWLEAIGGKRIRDEIITADEYRLGWFGAVPYIRATDEGTEIRYSLVVYGPKHIRLVILGDCNTRHEMVTALLGLKVNSSDIRHINGTV